MARPARRPTSQAHPAFSLGSACLGRFLLSLLLGSDFTTTLVAFDDAESSESSKDFVFSCISNGSEFFSLLFAGDGQDSSSGLVVGGRGLELLSGRVVDKTALGLASTTWEQDELRLVSVQASHVELQLLLTRVGSSVIDRDADSAGKRSCKTGMLKFIKSEAATISHLAGVLSRGRRNDWAQFLNGAGEGLGRLCDSTLVSSKLLGWLIEVALGAAVPVLAQMDVCYGVVVLYHC